MAQKRMINKSISYSKQVNKISLKSQFIFTWVIPHLDDFGLIDQDAEVIKSLVFPMNKRIHITDIETFKIEAEKCGLIAIYKDCIEYPKFYEHQSISKEKRTKSKFNKLSIIPETSQNFPEIPESSQSKIKEVKGSKEKGSKSLTPIRVKGKNPEIDELIKEMLQVFDLPVLDGSVLVNRRYCWLALKKFGGISGVRAIMAAAKANDFWENKITGFKSLYYHGVKIMASMRERPGPKVVSV